jgi:hypothetical protein
LNIQLSMNDEAGPPIVIGHGLLRRVSNPGDIMPQRMAHRRVRCEEVLWNQRKELLLPE